MEPIESNVTTNRRRAWLAALLLRQPDRFLPRLTAAIGRWQAMPRAVRRRLQRRVAATATGVALLLAMTAGPLFVSTARAATITVDDPIGDVADNGLCSLIEAILSANTDSPVFASAGECPAGAGADTINLTDDVALTDRYVDRRGWTGTPAVTSEIVVMGNGHKIERDTITNFRILFVEETGDLTLNDVTISGGYLSYEAGGGFYVLDGTMAINNTVISGNHANFAGGGMNEGGLLTITDSVFRENNSDGDSGALYQDQDSGAPFVVNTTITNSIFEMNTADGDGGAIYVDFGPMTITDTTFANNSSGQSGGVIYTYYPSTDVTITGSTLRDNEALNGGGVFVRDGTMTLVNSTVSGNRASSSAGGGIYNYSGDVTLTNTTLTDNSAYTNGGGLYQAGPYGTTTLIRSIISGNDAAASGDEVHILFGTSAADAYNLFGHNGLSFAAAFHNFSPGVSDFVATSDNTGIATHVPTPLAGILDTTLGDNGGPTDTHNLVSGSPAIDKAPNAGCAAAPVNGVDQRGAARPFDGVAPPTTSDCDAGAVEYGASPAPALLYIAPNRNNGMVDGVAYNDEDIIVNTLGTADWAMFFDGSDVGITKNLTDFTFTADDCLLMTFNGNQNVPGVGLVKPQDLVKFCPTLTGPTTAGSFTMYFDGSDVGLSAGSEVIDAVEVLPGGDLVISTKDKFNVPPALKGQKNDLLRFHATSYGPTTLGTWSLYFNNTQVAGLKKENIISLYIDSAGDKYVSFWDAYPNVGGVSGNENDILIFHPNNTVTKFWEGSDWGYTGRVHGLHIGN